MSRFKTQVREVINRNTVVSLAVAQGFNAFLPVYDGGIDLLLYRESDGLVHKVQLKSRWTIDRKYVGRDIAVAFPIGDRWYLIPHDEMLRMGESAGYTDTASWRAQNTYNLPSPSKAIVAACAPYRFASIDDVAEEAAKGDLST